MTMPSHYRDDEPTGRTKLVQEFDIFRDGAEKKAKRLHWWLQAVGGALVALVVVGIKVGFYLADVAHKEDIRTISDRLEVTERRQLVVDTKLDMLMDQMTAVAKTVRAPVIVKPEETKLTPPEKVVH